MKVRLVVPPLGINANKENLAEGKSESLDISSNSCLNICEFS
jgi:hypothetical protein